MTKHLTGLPLKVYYRYVEWCGRLGLANANRMFKTVTGYTVIPYFKELSDEQAEFILKQLEDENVKTRLKIYGDNTGSCGICGRELTDPLSVKRGIGPVCHERLNAASLGELI